MRFLLLALLVCGVVVARHVLFKTHLGELLRNRHAVQAWVDHHRHTAPVILIGVYILFGSLMLPVWWLQVSSGYCFSLGWGILYCEIGAVITAVLSLNLSRWLLGEWFHRKYESKMEKLRKIDQMLGHNGLFVVMTARLAHVLPFGISNYLFGLTQITTADIAAGTALGGSVAIGFYVALGAFGPEILKSWRFWTVLGTVNVLLLVPLILRYMFPRPFKKIGIE